ncbi:MAG: DUF309 domain-containing protein [Actinomycetota bacterium]|nr:DUF309 domain-containing protein [Actinomycetota bacterium]
MTVDAGRSRHPERDRDDQGRPVNARPRDRFGRPLARGAADELVAREDPEEVVDSLDEALATAVRLFDAQRFFEAHEFLEHIWKSAELDPADRDFWKGVTQVAVGCCHAQRGNAQGAVTLLERSVGYLRSYPSPHHGILTEALARTALRVCADVKERGASPDMAFPRFPLAGPRPPGR